MATAQSRGHDDVIFAVEGNIAMRSSRVHKNGQLE